MLVLGRKNGERVNIGDNIELVVVRVHGNQVRLGFEAPNDIPIHRSEVRSRINQQRRVVGRPVLQPDVPTEGPLPCP